MQLTPTSSFVISCLPYACFNLHALISTSAPLRASTSSVILINHNREGGVVTARNMHGQAAVDEVEGGVRLRRRRGGRYQYDTKYLERITDTVNTAFRGPSLVHIRPNVPLVIWPERYND